MRVLHVIPGKMFGGIETTLMAIVRFRELCPAMISEFAVCFEGRLSSELSAAGAAVHILGDVRVRNPASVWRARRRLRALLRQERFDIVFAHMEWTHAIFGPVVKSENIALAYGIHHPITGRHWIERWAARTSPDITIALTHFLAEEAKKLFPEIPAKVVYNPVAPAVALTARERLALRAEVDTPEHAVVIIQACRLQPGKGHRVCLDALGSLREMPGWVCWQAGGPQRAGEGEYLDALRAHAAQLQIADRVRFLGQRPDVSRLLAAADVYCQPNDTFREGLGNVFVEAMRAGLPVVTSAIGAAPEVLGGSCGFLLEAGDVAGLAAALVKLISSPALRSELVKEGQARAAALFAPEVQLPLLCSYLAKAVGGKRFSSGAQRQTATDI